MACVDHLHLGLSRQWILTFFVNNMPAAILIPELLFTPSNSSAHVLFALSNPNKFAPAWLSLCDGALSARAVS